MPYGHFNNKCFDLLQCSANSEDLTNNHTISGLSNVLNHGKGKEGKKKKKKGKWDSEKKKQ